MTAGSAQAARSATQLPSGRGPLLERLLTVLRGTASSAVLAGDAPAVSRSDPYGDDVQLALYLCYELHYRPLVGVDADLEWDAELLAFRRLLERAFLAALRADVARVAAADAGGDDDVDAALAPLLLEPSSGTGPSWFLQSSGEPWHLAEYVAHRSIYHLKEADPQSWVIPRLDGQAKASLVAVQHDEYGAGRGERMHAQLFAEMMLELGLDAGYGAYLDAVPAATLAPVNLMSMLGLHRSLRGAAVGQFAMIEVTSSPGSRRMSAACARLGAPKAGTRFYDEHIEADAVHEQVIRHELLADLLEREPELAADVIFGIRSSLLLDDRLGEHMMSTWTAGKSSLRRPLAQRGPSSRR